MAEVKGLKELLTKLKKLGKEGEKRIAETTEITAKDIEAKAKNNVTNQNLVDTGKLRQDIRAVEVDPLNWKIYANFSGLTPYSAYHEFGTGGLYVPHPELSEMASDFRGGKIRLVNIRPRPYLYPAFVDGRIKYIDELKNELEALTNGI